MNTNEAILARRSVRSYLPEPVSKALVQSLLESAVHAPSAMNAQPWLFAIVQDRARLRRYSDLAKLRLLRQLEGAGEEPPYVTMLRDEAFNIFYDAGTLVVIGSAEKTRFTQADCWLAAGSLMLAARAAGLGTCCIGFALDLLNSDEIKSELGIPTHGEVVAALILGHPVAFPPPVERAPPKVTAWLEAGAAKSHPPETPRDNERYAREHPAGFLATRLPPPVTERVGHPPIHDDPGFGAVGHRRLAEGERELSLGTSLPEAWVSQNQRRSRDDAR